MEKIAPKWLDAGEGADRVNAATIPSPADGSAVAISDAAQSFDGVKSVMAATVPVGLDPDALSTRILAKKTLLDGIATKIPRLVVERFIVKEPGKIETTFPPMAPPTIEP